MAVRVDASQGEAAVGLVLAAVGAALVYFAVGMPLGTVRAPGPGFAPLALGVFLALVGLACAVRGWRQPAIEPVVLGETKVLVCLALLAAGIVAWTTLGYLPTSAAFLTISFRVFARISWVRAFAIGVVSAVIIWVIFEKALGVPLPGGVLPL
jgi:putative tricarboxylic transport membrane protein